MTGGRLGGLLALGMRVGARAARCAIAAAILLLVFSALHRPARARREEALLATGAQLLRIAEARQQDRPRTFYLNEVPIELAAGVSDREIDPLLADFARSCSGDRATMPDLAAAPATPNRQREGERLRLRGAVRSRDGVSGIISCIDSGDGLLEIDIVERARAFVRSADATELGSVRFLYAERRAGRTHYIGFWPGAALDLAAILPGRGDSPGRDPDGISRPPGARRLLSAREEGHASTTTIYRGSSLDLAQLHQFYRDDLAAGAWQPVGSRSLREGVTGEARLFGLRAGVLAAVVIADAPGGMQTIIMTAAADGLAAQGAP